jgi:SPP1 gp7 family putative phage head morphogenesis protein
MTNAELIDVAVDHVVDTQFYANRVANEQIGQVNTYDAELLAALLALLISLPSGANASQIDTALSSALAINGRAFAQMDPTLRAALAGAVEAEAEFQKTLYGEIAAAADGQPTVPDNLSLINEALGAVILGLGITDYVNSLRDARATNIRRAIQRGFSGNESAASIMKTVREILGKTRLDIDTIVRSAITNVTQHAAAIYHARNEDLVAGVIWLSVLDGRTTDMCRVRAGKRYTVQTHRPIGHGYPWLDGPGRLHFNCRSTSAPLVRGEVPKDNSYDAWLRRQSKARQDEILGPTRGAIYRASGAPIERFSNNRGKELTLAELKQKGLSTKTISP